jgi:hypothetical protein
MISLGTLLDLLLVTPVIILSLLMSPTLSQVIVNIEPNLIREAELVKCIDDPRQGDGLCDLDLNSKQCHWDSGDCCPSTCVPGEILKTTL